MNVEDLLNKNKLLEDEIITLKVKLKKTIGRRSYNIKRKIKELYSTI